MLLGSGGSCCCAPWKLAALACCLALLVLLQLLPLAACAAARATAAAASACDAGLHACILAVLSAHASLPTPRVCLPMCRPRWRGPHTQHPLLQAAHFRGGPSEARVRVGRQGLRSRHDVTSTACGNVRMFVKTHFACLHANSSRCTSCCLSTCVCGGTRHPPMVPPSAVASVLNRREMRATLLPSSIPLKCLISTQSAATCVWRQTPHTWCTKCAPPTMDR